MGYYRVNKTDGTFITEVIDGTIDTETLDIALIGKNATAYGETLNENLVKLLENFASITPPEKPIIGQLWFDTKNSRLQIYDGLGFKNSVGTVVAPSNPLTLTEGDIWIDSQNKQAHFYDGVDTILMGPIYTARQDLSGFEIDTIYDRNNRGHTVTKLFSGGKILGFISSEEYVLKNTIEYFNDVNTSRQMKIGFNSASDVSFYMDVIAEKSKSLYDVDLNITKVLNQFVFTDEDNIVSGSLKVQNADGVTIGNYDDAKLYSNIENNFVIEQQFTDTDIILKVKRVQYTNGIPVGVVVDDALRVDSSAKTVNIYPLLSAHDSLLDVNGAVNINGVKYTTKTISLSTDQVLLDEVLISSDIMLVEYKIYAYEEDTLDYRYTTIIISLLDGSDYTVDSNIQNNLGNEVFSYSVSYDSTGAQLFVQSLTSDTVILKYHKLEL